MIAHIRVSTKVNIVWVEFFFFFEFEFAPMCWVCITSVSVVKERTHRYYNIITDENILVIYTERPSDRGYGNEKLLQ